MDKITLAKFLVPKNKTDLVRFGSKFDGGYLLNEIDLTKSDTLISLGIHENWDFEKEIYEKYDLKKIILFDPETSYFLILQYLIKSILKCNFKKIFNYIIKFKELQNLKSKSIFFKKKFNKKLLTNLLKSQNIILKVDIEGDEYLNLEFILENQNKINCLVIEFHDLDENYEKIKNFISKFKLKLVHTHINTFSREGEVAVELTFSKNALADREKWDQYSLAKIDHPNHPSHQNIQIIE